jgi:hypothetical protein
MMDYGWSVETEQEAISLLRVNVGCSVIRVAGVPRHRSEFAALANADAAHDARIDRYHHRIPPVGIERP